MKNKRGIALELAITTMMIIFALCLILLTVAELTAHFNEKTLDGVETRAEIDAIGEVFVSSIINRQVFVKTGYPEEYVIRTQEIEGGYRIIILDAKSVAEQAGYPPAERNEKMLLTVEVNGSGTQSRITRWLYGTPADTANIR